MCVLELESEIQKVTLICLKKKYDDMLALSDRLLKSLKVKKCY